MRIAVVAPSSRFDDWAEVAARVQKLADAAFPGVEIVFHPQCALVDHHFAGSDAARLAALVEVADDPGFDAVWFARGGYGSNRIAADAVAAMGPRAREKSWLGYSDAGFLLAALYRAGFPDVAHGPMPRDIMRDGGEAAVARALAWLTARASNALEPDLTPGMPHAAFNLTVLGMLLGTGIAPDLTGHILLVEEVSEHLYASDRAFFHLTATPAIRGIAGLRLGRFDDILPNEPSFGHDAEAIARLWCERAGIAFLGPADIGHDSGNKVVPFGLLERR